MKLISLVAGNFDVNDCIHLSISASNDACYNCLANDRAASVVTVLTAASAGVIFQEGYAAILQMDIALYILFGGFASLIIYA